MKNGSYLFFYKWKVKSEEWKVKNRADAIRDCKRRSYLASPYRGKRGGLCLLYHSYKHGADEEMVDGHEGVAFVVPGFAPWVFADEVEDGVACGFVGDVCHSGYCHGVLVCCGVLLECFLPYGGDMWYVAF